MRMLPSSPAHSLRGVRGLWVQNLRLPAGTGLQDGPPLTDPVLLRNLRFDIQALSFWVFTACWILLIMEKRFGEKQVGFRVQTYGLTPAGAVGGGKLGAGALNQMFHGPCILSKGAP